MQFDEDYLMWLRWRDTAVPTGDPKAAVPSLVGNRSLPEAAAVGIRALILFYYFKGLIYYYEVYGISPVPLLVFVSI